MTQPPQPTAEWRPAFDAASLAAAVGGQLLAGSPHPIRGAAVDSRRVEPGNVFFALPGERTDGHRFLQHALERGAAALVVTRPIDGEQLARLTGGGAEGATVIRAGDGLAALHAAAAAWRNRFTPLVVAVTGSLAKTSTKEQIAEVLSEELTVLRSMGNENNEIGLPLTLLRLAPEHAAAVLEMGMYVPGDIGQLAALARPEIGVVTAVRGTHLTRAGSIEAIERGKRELVEALPEHGTAVLNGDDPRVAAMASAAPPGVRVLTYGFEPAADVSARAVEPRHAQGMAFMLRAVGAEIRVQTPALGRHGVHNCLAAAAVGLAAGLDLPSIARGLARPALAPHRSTLIQAGQWRILDDTYNAAPDSMAAALELLASLPGRRVAVLGEMLELGAASRDAHRAIGEHAGRVAQLLVAVGPMAAEYAAGAQAAGLAAQHVLESPDRETALRLLIEHLRPSDVVLVKASRGAELDLLVDGLRAAAGEGARA